MNGVRQKVCRIGSKQLRLVEYSKNMPPHWCEKSHFGYILHGRMKIEFENEVHTYSLGDGVFIPKGQQDKHMARILTEKVAAVFVEDV